MTPIGSNVGHTDLFDRNNYQFNNKSKNGIEIAFPSSFFIDRPEIASQADNKVMPISAPRDMVRPQPSRPDSLIKSVSGVTISAPNAANPTPNQGLLPM